MMLFALLKKDFLIVKKYVLIMLVVIALIPPVMRWRTPEFTGVFGFILSVIFGVFMLLQYVSLKEYQFPKATTLLCATPFSRKAIVSSKYIFCMAIYKFGYEKTKFAFGVIIMASPFILPLLMRAGNLNLNFLSMFSPYLVYGGIVLIGFAILAISASLSIKIYDKADLA